MRKLLVILGMITCMVGLSACGQTVAENPANEKYLQDGLQLVENLNQFVQRGAEDQIAVPVAYEGAMSWKKALADIGDYQGTDGGTVKQNKNQIVISVNVLGSEHNAVVEIILEEPLDSPDSIKSISTNVTYSFGELMGKAGLNTLIGMGTVFTVLILICLIISSFGLISKIQNSQKKAQPQAVERDPVVTQIAEKEELSDDAELAAVIAAAVAAYEGSGSTDGFVVRSIRKSNKSKWQNA